jgi:NADH/F420H2 dehydrogenase subunit C
MDIRTPIAENGGDWLPRFGAAWKKQIEELKARLGSKIEEITFPGEGLTDVPILRVQADAIVEVLSFLKTQPSCAYDFLADITATDELEYLSPTQPSDPRFEVVYQLFSTVHRYRIRVKVRVAETQEVPTAIPVWKGANWAEREVFDMFGVRFKGHPNLRRILMDPRWEGHPLRKDYSIRGYQIFTDAQAVDPAQLEG